VIWIHASYNPIIDDEGKTVVVKFATDITDVKLRNADYAGRLAAVDRVQAVIEFDLQGRILCANENFLEVVGYSLAEIRASTTACSAILNSPIRMSTWRSGNGWRAVNSMPVNSAAAPRPARISGSWPPTTRFSMPTASHTKW
jgi:methyl-accepting chemotaxis protein